MNVLPFLSYDYMLSLYLLIHYSIALLPVNTTELGFTSDSIV